MTEPIRPQIKITGPALDDIESIAAYTAFEWGETKAKTYLAQIDQAIRALPENPSLGQMRYTLKLPIRGLRVGSHIVFYRLENDLIFILRILHQSMDHGQHINTDA